MSFSFNQYDPPYESPIENDFAWSLAKYVCQEAKTEKQVEAETICGTFRLDLVVTTASGERIGYECDGEEFHDKSRDEWRDAMILGAGAVDEIARIPGSAITYHLDDVLLVLSGWTPSVFSDRSRVILQRLASNIAKTFDAPNDPLTCMLTYPEQSQSKTCPLHIFLDRRTRKNPAGVQRQFWQRAFELAKSVGGGNLDNVIPVCREMLPARVT